VKRDKQIVTMAYLKDQLLRTCYWLGDLLNRVLLTTSIGAAAVSAAIFLYGAFYFAMIPSTALSLPVSFVFNSCQTVGQPCSYITGVVNIKPGQLVPGLKYSIQLLLDVPDSASNAEVGMFLTCAKITYGGEVDQESAGNGGMHCSSALVPYRSSHLRILDTVMWSPLYLTGLTAQNTELEIEIKKEHQENPHAPTQRIDLEIRTSKLQIYKGILKIWTDLTGVRYWMYHHPHVSSVVGVTSMLTIICSLAALSIARFLSPQSTVNVSTVSPNNSNHDLAARSARAREILEARQGRFSSTSGYGSGPEVVEETLEQQQQQALGDRSAPGTQALGDGLRQRSGWD